MSSPASGNSIFGPSAVSGAAPASAGTGPTSTGGAPATTVTPQKAPGSAAKDAPSSKSYTPTAKDSLFMLTIVMLNENPVNVDWDKVAEELGFKNAGVAKVCFCLLSLALSPPLHTCRPVWARVCVLSGPVSLHCGPVGVSSGPVGLPSGPVSLPSGPVSLPSGPVSLPSGSISLPFRHTPLPLQTGQPPVQTGHPPIQTPQHPAHSTYANPPSPLIPPT